VFSLFRYSPKWQCKKTASTMRAAESHLRAHIIPKVGSLPLTAIRTKEVQSFVAYLATGGRSRKPVENVLLTLSSLLKTARAWAMRAVTSVSQTSPCHARG
jgi:hypothetical protein